MRHGLYTSNINEKAHELLYLLQKNPEDEAARNELVTLLIPQAEYVAYAQAKRNKDGGYSAMDYDECFSAAMEGILNVIKNRERYDISRNSFHRFAYAVMERAIIDRWRTRTHYGHERSSQSLSYPTTHRQDRLLDDVTLIPGKSTFDTIEIDDICEQCLTRVQNHFKKSPNVVSAFEDLVSGIREGRNLSEVAETKGQSYRTFSYLVMRARKFLQTNYPNLGNDLNDIIAEMSSSDVFSRDHPLSTPPGNHHR